MYNKLTGFIAVVLIVVYLGYYAIMLHAPPLWVIIAACVLLFVADYVLTVRSSGETDGPRSGG